MLLFGEFTLSVISAVLIILFFGMGLHEFGHALAADWWGDPTPRSNGKLTINPLAHIDLQGWIMVLLIGFGTLGSVAINPRLMRDSRWGSFWTSLAGPLMNLLQAIVLGILFRFVGDIRAVGLVVGSNLEVWQLGAYGLNPLMAYLSIFLYVGVWYNLMLFVFNLLPLFPLDGYRIMLTLLPGYFLSKEQVPNLIRQNFPSISRFLQQPAFAWQDWQMLTYYVFIGLLLLSYLANITGLHFLNIISLVIGTPVSQLMQLILF